ncbi:MAG TPA: hypothetical protein VF473_08525 [Cyclobacteriaceae bacterium]
MHDRTKFYTQRIAKLGEQHATLSRQQREISGLRLVLFLLMIGSIVWATLSGSVFLLVTLVLTGFFMAQVKRHAKVSLETSVIGNILQLNRDELAFMKGDKSLFPQGDIQLAVDHIYAIDLDIFGKGSLFQAIDRTGTWEGKGLVIDTLLVPPKGISEIEQRKESISELAKDVEWRQRFNVVGKMADETPDDMPSLRQWAQQPDFFAGRGSWIWVARLMSAVSAAFIIWMVIVGEFYFLSLVALFIFNSAIRGLFNKELGGYFSTFGSKTKLFGKFADLFQLVSKHAVTTPLAKQHFDKVHEAADAFLELSQLSNRAEQRRNGLVGPVMNGLFLYDVWNVYAIERWRLKHRDRIDPWIAALANIDMLSSLANYRFNHPMFADASVETGQSFLKAKEMGHPLLPFEESVKNDYELGVTSKAHIVTGSNMAGKSTFIRTVSLNIILALNGLPVCAKEFSCSVVSIASCIRITDSLEEHASYFRAELRRLEKIIALLKTGEPYLVLLDEILRGTNSDDKRMGTLAFFKKLKDYNCLAILATHDLVIGKLEEQFPEHYANYCFESSLSDGELRFDYRLRKGVSESTNATYLMRSLGLID